MSKWLVSGLFHIISMPVINYPCWERKSHVKGLREIREGYFVTNKAKSGSKHGGLDQSFTNVSTSACLDQNADVSYSLSHTRGIQMLVCNEANVENISHPAEYLHSISANVLFESI